MVEKVPALKVLNKEFAATGDTIGLSYSPTGVISPWNFGILRSLASNLEAFEGILQDTQVQSTLQQRRLALVGKDWNVDPGAEDAQSIAAADFMREQLEALRWDDITDKMHYGVFYGFSVAELMYARDGGKIVVDEVKVRKRTRFRFDLKGQLRLLNSNNALEGEIMPPGKFWTFATGGDSHENPYGIGLAHWLYFPTLFKNKGIKFWLIFLDKYAMPTALGQHDFGNDENDTRIGQLVEALQAIHTDSGVAIPKGVEITLLEATRSGTNDYSTLARYMDQAISKVVVGQTMTTDDGSSLSQAQVHNEVREDIVKADADLICESWNRGPGRWLTAWNFPGATPPRVWREVEPEEDLDSRADRDTKIKSLGFKPTLDYITETYGEGWEESSSGDPDPNGDGDEGGLTNKGKPTQFAAVAVLPREDTLKTAIDDLLDDNETLNAQTGQVIEPVFALIRRVGMEKALEQLVGAYPRISSVKLTEALARAQFVAHVWGRLSAQAEIDGE